MTCTEWLTLFVDDNVPGLSCEAEGSYKLLPLRFERTVVFCTAIYQMVRRCVVGSEDADVEVAEVGNASRMHDLIHHAVDVEYRRRITYRIGTPALHVFCCCA